MVNIIADYIPAFAPLPNIAPFTYKDGETYLSTLDNLRTYVNTTLVTFVNTNYGALSDSTTLEISTFIAQVNAQFDTQDTNISDNLATINALVDTVNGLVTTANTDLDAANSAVTIANAAASAATAAAATANAFAIANDTAVASYVDSEGSDTTIALRDSFTVRNKMMFNVKSDYNALGDRPLDPVGGNPLTIGSDDTAAFNAAITAANSAGGRDNANNYDSGIQQHPTLYIPAGRYNVGDLIQVTAPNLRIVGDGRDQTILYHTGTTRLFQFGEFTTTPANPWQGTSGNAEIADLSIVQLNEWKSTEGSRTRTAIQDNFCGGFRIHGVQIYGFKYGFTAAGSSDFSEFWDCIFARCDVGMLLGPQTQQFSLSKIFFYSNAESLVLESVVQGSIRDCWFNDATTTHIAFENNAVTRLGVTTFRILQDQRIEIGTCWFEDSADPIPNRVCYEHIRISSDSGKRSKGIWIHDCQITAGGTKSTVRAFLRALVGTDIFLQRNKCSGILDFWVAIPTGTYPYINQSDISTIDGYAVVPLWATGADRSETESQWVGAKYFDSFTNTHSDNKTIETWMTSSTTGIRKTQNVSGIISLAFTPDNSTWYTRLGFDVQNRKIYFDDPSVGSSMCIGRNDTIPTIGSFAIGSFVYNTNPTIASGKILLGWSKLTTGSNNVVGTDWTPVYCTTS